MDETTRSELGESRWPMAGAVVAVIVLTYLLPAQVRVVSFGSVRVVPILEAVLLVALIIGDPGRIDRRTTALQRLATALVLIMLGGALVQTVALTVDLIQGGGVTASGRLLLEAGSIVWVVNNISFALLYWQLDSGGAPARVHHVRTHPDFAFPQQLAPDLAPRGVDARILRLLLSRLHQRDRVQPHRRHAAHCQSQSAHAGAITGLAGARRASDRTGGQRPAELTVVTAAVARKPRRIPETRAAIGIRLRLDHPRPRPRRLAPRATRHAMHY